eukprot:2887444-Rhodomonas_salina.1
MRPVYETSKNGNSHVHHIMLFVILALNSAGAIQVAGNAGCPEVKVGVWREITSETTSPSARHGMGFVELGNTLLLFGGYSA